MFLWFQYYHYQSVVYLIKTHEINLYNNVAVNVHA